MAARKDLIDDGWYTGAQCCVKSRGPAHDSRTDHLPADRRRDACALHQRAHPHRHRRDADAAGAGGNRHPDAGRGALRICERTGHHRGLGIRHIGGADRNRAHRAHWRRNRAGRGLPRMARDPRRHARGRCARGVFAPPHDHGHDAADHDAPRARAEPVAVAAADADVARGFARHDAHDLQRTGLPPDEPPAADGRAGDARHLRHHADRRGTGRSRHRLHVARPLDPSQAQGAGGRGGLPAPRPVLHRGHRRGEVALDRPADGGFQPVLRRPPRGRRMAAKRRPAAQQEPRLGAARGRRAVCQRDAGRNRLGRKRTGPRTARGQEIRRVDRAGPRRRAAAGAGRRRAAFAVHRRDHRRSGLPQDLRRRGRGHVAPAGLDTRPPVPGEVERGRPAGAARHAGPVRGARIPSRHPDDGAVLRAATASPACGANAPDRGRRRGRGRVRHRPGADGVPRRRCRVGPDGLRQRRSRLPRDRRAHLRDDRRRHSARPRHGADRHCCISRGAAPVVDRRVDARSQ